VADLLDQCLESVWRGAWKIIEVVTIWSGDKLSTKVPETRPIDTIAASRRLKGDIKELYTEYQKLLKYTDGADQTLSAVCWGEVIKVLNPSPEQLTHPFILAANQLCQDILRFEGYFPLPEIDFRRQFSLGEAWDLQKRVRRVLAFYETESGLEKIRQLLWMFLSNILFDHENRPYLDEKLIRAQDEEALFATTLESLHPDIPRAIEAVGYSLGQGTTLPDGEPLPRLSKTYKKNVCWASGIDPSELETTHKQLIYPGKMRGKSPSELMRMYLSGTPFADFFSTPLPITIPLDTRFAHMHILGGSGHGKTQTLQNLILTDLGKIRSGERSVVVIDSQGDLILTILKLKAVGDILDRVVLIYPKDLKHPPALNLFDFGLDRLGEYADVDREMLLNGAVSLYEYMFGAVLGADLTAKQGVIFGYLARLLLVVPGATIATLIDFLEEPEKVRPYLPQLKHPLTRRFFDAQFFNKSFDETRQQILYRIYDVMKTETIARMFQNPRNKVNIFEAMNRGSLILIHTAKDLLKQEGCEILGRFFIALITQAAQERAAIPKASRTPTFVYIDEAHDYFDENIEILLEQARKYQVGMILAHQHLAQFATRKLRSAVTANTAIKLAGGLSEADAKALCGNMGTTAEFLLSMKKYENERITQFACFVRNLTPHAIPLMVPLGLMEEAEKIKNPHVLNELFRRNWEKHCADLTDENGPDEPGRAGDTDSPLGDPDDIL
jgi:type IV secretion system coupling TraD/TrwB family protein